MITLAAKRCSEKPRLHVLPQDLINDDPVSNQYTTITLRNCGYRGQPIIPRLMNMANDLVRHAMRLEHDKGAVVFQPRVVSVWADTTPKKYNLAFLKKFQQLRDARIFLNGNPSPCWPNAMVRVINDPTQPEEQQTSSWTFAFMDVRGRFRMFVRRGGVYKLSTILQPLVVSLHQFPPSVSMGPDGVSGLSIIYRLP